MGFKIKSAIPITLLSVALLLTANTALAINQGFCGLITSLYKYGIGAIGILAALGIAIAGVIWVTAAGSDTKIKEAKSWIGSSIMGLALALTAFLILGTINPALTTCNTYSLSTIGSLGTNYSTDTDDTSQQLVRSPKSQQKGLTLDDGSGVYWCCVIEGDLQGSPIIDTTVQRCESYAQKDKTVAQKNCTHIYNNYNQEVIYIDGFTKVNGKSVETYKAYRAYLETLLKEGGGGKNSASIYSGRCENNTLTKNWCLAKADATFCKNQSDGDSCRLTDGITWGYCKNDKCNPCKKWGDKCDQNYECPHQLHKLSTRCGNDMISTFSRKGPDCNSTGFLGFTGKSYCDYEGPENYY